jgi:rhodanese-related sulfurtransferase
MNDQQPPDEIEIDPEQVARWIADGRREHVIDVREPDEREAGHIPGTRHIPLGQLSEQAGTLTDGEAVVFYCRVGARSLMAAQALRASGRRAYSMSGGLMRWAAEERPLSPEGGRVADH